MCVNDNVFERAQVPGYASSMPAPNLMTERLICRQWRMDDLESAFRMYGDAEVARYLGQDLPTPDIETQRANLEKLVERYSTMDDYSAWAMEERTTREVVGTVLLKPLPNSELIEVGWHLAREHWGKGFATEAAREAMRYGFEDLEIEKIYAIVIPENERSIRVTQRLGMRPIGRTTEFHDIELLLFESDRIG